MSYRELLSDSRKDLFPGDGFHMSGPELLKSPFGDGSPFAVDFRIWGIERPEQGVNNDGSLFHGERLRLVYDFGCTWHE